MENRVNKKGSETTKIAMNAPMKNGWKEVLEEDSSRMAKVSLGDPPMRRAAVHVKHAHPHD